ncbi:MAG: RluA family pseudouridine synthase [Planctomycetota bacterium]
MTFQKSSRRGGAPIQINWEQCTSVTIPVKKSGLETYRIDVYLTKRLNEYSRTLIQRLIKEGLVKVNQHRTKPSYELNQGDIIEVALPRLIKPQTVAEDIPLDVIYEDNDIIAINKPPGMVVHPAAGHWRGTLVNALLHHCDSLGGDPTKAERTRPTQNQGEDIYRPGIVHRLDKNTSGIILAAKTARAYLSLGKQFAGRQIFKEYLAVVHGQVQFDSDTIVKPLGRHQKEREKMAVRKEGEGREAISYYELQERFKKFSVVKVFPKTGRTHQIRVHLASIKHPIAGDVTYGGKKEIFLSDIGDLSLSQPDDLLLDRPALHAARITFTHPATDESLSLTAETAPDIKNFIQRLKQYK